MGLRQGHRRQPPSPSRSNQRQQLRHRLGLAGPASPSPGPRRDRELERGGRGRRAAWQGRRTKVASLISWRDSASVNSKRSRAFLPASACGPGQEPGGAINLKPACANPAAAGYHCGVERAARRASGPRAVILHAFSNAAARNPEAWRKAGLPSPSPGGRKVLGR